MKTLVLVTCSLLLALDTAPDWYKESTQMIKHPRVIGEFCRELFGKLLNVPAASWVDFSDLVNVVRIVQLVELLDNVAFAGKVRAL